MRQFVEITQFDATKKVVPMQQVTMRLLVGGRSEVYKTLVFDVIDKERFTINIPFAHRTEIRLPAGSRVEIQVEHSSGIFILPVRILKKTDNPIEEWLLEISGIVRKVQERQFFRVKVEELTRFKKVVKLKNEDGSEVFVEKDSTIHPAAVRDLSATGMQLICDDSLIEVGDRLKIDFSFVNPKLDHLIAMAVRLIPAVEAEEPGQGGAGLQFIHVDDEKTNEILEWLFDKQREKIRQRMTRSPDSPLL